MKAEIRLGALESGWSRRNQMTADEGGRRRENWSASLRQSCQPIETNYSRGMKSYLYATGLLLSVGLLGCKPKTATVAGQVFIVTRGAESIKLGAVEILLIEKTQVRAFLQAKQPAIESAIAFRQQELVSAQEEVTKAQASFDWFLMNGLPATNADFLEIESQIKAIHRQEHVLGRQYSLISAQVQAARSRLDTGSKSRN